MDLSTSVGDTESAAAGFTTFRVPLPDHAAEVTTLISDLYAISASLTSLGRFSQDVRYRRNWPLIEPDVELVRKSLKYTLEDIFKYFRRIDKERSPESYRRAWTSMDGWFWDESHYSLSTRLARYKSFLREMGDVMKDRLEDLPLLPATRRRLKQLLALQEERLTSNLGRMSLNDQIPPINRPPSRNDRPSSILRPPSRNNRPPSRNDRPPSRNDRPTSIHRPPSRNDRPTSVHRSHSRNRPLSSGNGAEPISPVGDRRRRRSFERARPFNPQSPQSPLSPSSGTFSDSFPPSVPDPPSSPLTGSVSATTTTSQSTQNDILTYHWVKDVFNSYRTETAIPESSEKAGCFDEPQSGIKTVLKEQGFERALQLAFNDRSEMTAYFYLREKDGRARIVCKVPHRSKPSEYFCLPLNMLEVVQKGSCLQLCRRRNSGKKLILWARLKFTTVESMVVFFCTFLALRSQDEGRPVEDIQDHELNDEEEMYGGLIIDDRYSHALRVYQDKITGAVRLQASVHEGVMDRTPVWTAFVTHHLGRRSWLKTLDSKTVAVRDLDLAIFISTDEYSPPHTNRGEHLLKFATRSDAEGFLDCMQEIAAASH
ncbi:hypothetical protein N7478_003314 [Penicillium angulare]|uniref:uncharacterized protein n=1 Tax=Penicillium angulare TaxID=116970 RepID=UPI00253F9FFB|nr:uncharacterized protein N7478_003314 [Penicillium angulare]KAJ5287628.1 hypothetical protein N7478_003314 [Penicillium angulare]